MLPAPSDWLNEPIPLLSVITFKDILLLNEHVTQSFVEM